MTEALRTSRIQRFGVFEFDPAAAELRKQGMKLNLQGQPIEILALLLEHPGKVVTRQELQKKLWASDTYVDFEHSLNAAVKRLRDALDDSADEPRFIETIPRRGYRFIAQVKGHGLTGIGRHWKVIVSAALAITTVTAGGHFYFRDTPKLRDKTTIVLADFANTTGDAVFDGTLREGLSVQLEQSPFLNLVSDQQIQETLRQMAQPAEERLTAEIALEVCRRTNSAGVLSGSIAQIGERYNLTLKAVNCATGELLASTVAQASDKNRVLDVLGKIALEMRRKLGESLDTVQKYDTPLAQATTPSLQALQAFSLGVKTLTVSGDNAAALLFLKRATELDPKFAGAYQITSGVYWNLGEPILAAASARKAFELRERASEEEKLEIEGAYYLHVTGDWIKAREIGELGEQTYPQHPGYPLVLGVISSILGQHERSLGEHLRSLSLTPWSGSEYCNVVEAYLTLDRFEDARGKAEEARAKGLDSALGVLLYSLAFLQNNKVEMARQVALSAGKPGVENSLLAKEADTAAYFGHLRKAREYTLRAVDSAESTKQKEASAEYSADSGAREALLGNYGEARRRATEVRGQLSGYLAYQKALALADIGDEHQARALADDLSQRFPEDAVVQLIYLPTLRAKLEIDRKDPARAVETLRALVPYELGLAGRLMPVYLRGESYLAAHQGLEAAAEFQKILDHRGIVLNSLIGALAHLQLGRAYVLQGNRAKGRAKYQDFLTLWKDADPDIPILQRAKAEYAKLQ